jgi:hypothetical protein
MTLYQIAREAYQRLLAASLSKDDIRFRCSSCGDKAPRPNVRSCRMCDGAGWVMPTGSHIYCTGFQPVRPTKRVLTPGTVAFEWQGVIWLGTTCPADEEPFRLADAWWRLFPDCLWVPNQFVVLDRLADYRRVPGVDASMVLRRIHTSLKTQVGKSAEALAQVERFLASE